jgi:hypothetical protein
MNVSERVVYMARELVRTGREDLILECEQGRMTVLGALKIAKPEKYRPKVTPVPNGTEVEFALQAAWTRATNDERLAFLEWIIAND